MTDVRKWRSVVLQIFFSFFLDTHAETVEKQTNKQEEEERKEKKTWVSLRTHPSLQMNRSYMSDKKRKRKKKRVLNASISAHWNAVRNISAILFVDEYRGMLKLPEHVAAEGNVSSPACLLDTVTRVLNSAKSGGKRR